MKPTNPLWYLAAFLIAIGSTMLGTAIAASAWDPVRDVSVTPTTVRTDALGSSVAVFTDIVQPDRDVVCRAKGPDKGAKNVEIPPAKLDITVDDEGNQWHLIGLLPDGTDDLKIRCAAGDRRANNATYAYATVAGFESRTNTGNGVGLIGVAIGAIFAGYVFHCRRQSRKAILRPA